MPDQRVKNMPSPGRGWKARDPAVNAGAKSWKPVPGVIPYRRWVLVTGCDSGFGALAARQLLDRGFGVIALCLTEDGCRDLSRDAQPEAQLQTIQCDLSRPQDLERLQAELARCQDGRLWALVNNAGIAIPGFVDFLGMEDFRRVMEVNFFASVALTKFCLPLLKQSRGRIINICSTCGLVALAANAPYNASKFALRAFTDTLRRECSAWGIGVALVIPGVMKTPINDKYLQTLERTYRQAPDELRSAYGEDYWHNLSARTAGMMHRIAGDPQQVVEAILHAVGSYRPKAIYLLGADSAMFHRLHRSSPRLADLLLNMSGRKKPAALGQRGSRRIEFTALCPANAKTTWKHFLETLWLRGAGLTPRLVVESAGDETGRGATRWIPVLGRRGIREGITETCYPDHFSYRVMDLASSIFPVKHHQGRVDFLPGPGGTTRLVWSVEYTPRPGASLPVKMVFRFIIPRYLQALVRACNNQPG